MRTTMPAWQLSPMVRQRVLSVLFFLLCPLAPNCWPQDGASPRQVGGPEHSAELLVNSHGSRFDPDAAEQPWWQGLPVKEVAFDGVPADRLQPLAHNITPPVGVPIDRQKIASSLRELYASGLFENIEAEVVRQDDGVRLIFRGTPREFIGTVSFAGAKGATINAQLEAASRLTAGTRFSQARIEGAIERMRQTLADNGFNEPDITYHLAEHPVEQLVDIAFTVTSGVQTRVGEVKVTGDSGMTVEQFRRAAHLRAGTKVDHDTNDRALNGVLKHYQKGERLEADVKLEAQTYAPAARRSNFNFSAQA